MGYPSPRKARKVFTTGEVARICNAAPTAVTRWIDAGHLIGYRVPGSKHRRVTRENLVKFLQENNMPMDGLASESSDPKGGR